MSLFENAVPVQRVAYERYLCSFLDRTRNLTHFWLDCSLWYWLDFFEKGIFVYQVLGMIRIDHFLNFRLTLPRDWRLVTPTTGLDFVCPTWKRTLKHEIVWSGLYAYTTIPKSKHQITVKSHLMVRVEMFLYMILVCAIDSHFSSHEPLKYSSAEINVIIVITSTFQKKIPLSCFP